MINQWFAAPWCTLCQSGSSCVPTNAVSLCVRSKCLTKAGYAVETAQDGLEALELLQKRQAEAPSQPPVDIILLDLFMPRMNGKELLVKLKAHHEVLVTFSKWRPFLFLCCFCCC
jgi:CheY-like chemotaxis protein